MPEKRRQQDADPPEEGTPGRGRVGFFSLLVTLVFLGLLAVVGWVQLRPSRALLEKAVREQNRLVYVPACRGELQARDGAPLNLTLPSYAIVIRPDMVRDPRDTRMTTLAKLEEEIASLASALGPEAYLKRPGRDQILRHLRTAPALPLTLWDEVDAETRARWLALQQKHPATELLLSWKRLYQEPELAYHLRGRVRSAPPRRDGIRRFWNASSPELQGFSGMERTLDYLLAGSAGAELLQTDVLSYRSQVLEYQAAVRGDDCRLALCLPAQRAAEEAFRRQGLSGAVVALEMETGKVLVMASLPSPSLAGGTSSPQGKSGGEQVNRALAGYYPPGSILKPLLALYALEHGVVSPRAPLVLDCPGYFSLGGGKRLGCSHVHGKVDLVHALSLSCNTYFCTLAGKLSREQWDDFAAFFAFGQKTGADLQEQEINGIPFSPAWVKEHRKGDKAWHPGDAANGAIGQGGWIITPMQIALAMNYAFTGKLFAPRYALDDEPSLRTTHAFPAEALAILKDGMRQCVLQGTGQSLNTPQLEILAKTGTAETGRNQRPHAWVVALAPANQPRFLVVVVAEHGGGGGKVAGPIARDVLLQLHREIPPPSPL
ncbi:MAG: peptidoglycan D,D-transpeptidase FtsI family protein [Oligosphaeraceae bacterium]